jgi:hypothetical protein
MNAGYVYVLAFDSGGVKVGRTQNKQNRLRTHKRNARTFGITITDSWVSPLHVEWCLNEDTLKALGTKHGGTPVTPEYFRGADYAAIVKTAERLPFTPPDEAAADGPPCLRYVHNPRSARECAITTGALDARAREAADSDRRKWWENARVVDSCDNCQADGLKREEGSPGTYTAYVCTQCSGLWAPDHECPTERAA